MNGIVLVDALPPSTGYRQDIYRLTDDDPPEMWLALHIPDRHPADTKAASAKQRTTLSSFFYGIDLLPTDAGWQQASTLMDLRALAYGVAELMPDGFRASHRIESAPLLAAYISRSVYLRTVAKGWSRGTSTETSQINRQQWLMLIASPFFRELVEAAEAIRSDLDDDTARLTALDRSAD